MRRIALLAGLLLVGSAQAQDIPLTKILAPGEGWMPLTSRLFPSIGGLATDSWGDVLISDRENKQVVRIGLDHLGIAKVETFAKLSEGPAGLAFDGEDRLHVCLPESGRLARIEQSDKETTLAEGLKGVRDLVVTRAGNIYCTVPAESAVYRVNKEGKRKVASGLGTPTGLALWPDRGSLVVADSGGTALSAFRISPDGTLSAGERYYPLRVRPKEKSATEGVTVDAGGLVYATSQEGVQVFDPTGRLCGVLLRPGPGVLQAVTFAGPDRDQLVLACGNRLFVRKLLMKGIR